MEFLFHLVKYLRSDNIFKGLSKDENYLEKVYGSFPKIISKNSDPV